ncbi:hypothetical protein L7F22_009180 [Adiantum nelumboides]|nr:hypothetical protein [Adiantum nelumboides]
MACSRAILAQAGQDAGHGKHGDLGGPERAWETEQVDGVLNEVQMSYFHITIKGKLKEIPPNGVTRPICWLCEAGAWGDDDCRAWLWERRSADREGGLRFESTKRQTRGRLCSKSNQNVGQQIMVEDTQAC